ADRAGQHQLRYPLGHGRGELSRDPPADRGADQRNLVKLETIHQLEIEMRDVVDAVEPIGQRAAAEARMRWRDQPMALGEQRGIGLVWSKTLAAVQEQQRSAPASLKPFEFDVRDGDKASFHGSVLSAAHTPKNRALVSRSSASSAGRQWC